MVDNYRKQKIVVEKLLIGGSKGTFFSNNVFKKLDIDQKVSNKIFVESEAILKLGSKEKKKIPLHFFRNIRKIIASKKNLLVLIL